MAGRVHDPRYQELVEKLRRARISAGLSQADLASKLDRRQQFVSKYESCERRLDIVEFIDIAGQLNLDWMSVLRATHTGGA